MQTNFSGPLPLVEAGHKFQVLLDEDGRVAYEGLVDEQGKRDGLGSSNFHVH